MFGAWCSVLEIRSAYLFHVYVKFVWTVINRNHNKLADLVLLMIIEENEGKNFEWIKIISKNRLSLLYSNHCEINLIEQQ